ncbi:MAG: hypothetical protein NT171_20430 [Planctomycetota bacterium]|nr:hypothetical protein [Planctomycetota bacterium]
MTVLPLNGGTAGAAKAAEALATTPVKSLAEWSAKCGAIETRHATPQAPASAGEGSQKMTEPAATSEVTAGSIDF